MKSNKIDMDAIPEAYFIVENGTKTHFARKADMDNYRKEKTGINKISYYQRI